MKWVYILVLAIVIALSILASLPFSAGRGDSEIYTPVSVSITATVLLRCTACASRATAFLNGTQTIEFRLIRLLRNGD
jgi:hypothetical protein